MSYRQRLGSIAAAGGAILALPFATATAHAGPEGGWQPIIECESGGNPNAHNPHSSASGLFQFLDSTWRSVGGTGEARDASVAEQYMRAEILYDRAGTRPWNASRHCWAGKVGHSAPAPVAPAPAPSGGSYTVRPGDTLGEIAGAHGTTWRAIFAANRGVIDDPDLIYVGQGLNLP